MKKLYKALFCWSLIGTLVIANAYDTKAVGDDEISINSISYNEVSADEIINSLPDAPSGYGDDSLTKDSIEVGLNFANSKNMQRSSEVWSLVSQSTYRPYGVIRGHYIEKVPAGITVGYGVSGNFSTSSTSDGITFGSSVSFSYSYTRTGPSGSEDIGGNYATHRYFVAIGSGTIVKYYYKITDQYTGNVIRYETVYLVSNATGTTYSLLAYYNANNKMTRIRSATSNSLYSNYESTLINLWNSSNAYNYIDF